MKRSKTVTIDTSRLVDTYNSKNNNNSKDSNKTYKSISYTSVEPHQQKCLPAISTISKSKTTNNIVTLSNGEVKLISPYGDFCAFSGGGGSGGCVITGPYEAMILPKDDFTDDSFESTDESDAGQDQNDTEGITHNDFKNHDVVWAKRACSPWFPSIIINPNEQTKETKDLIKSIGAQLPTKEQLATQNASAIRLSSQSEKIYAVFMFNRKKSCSLNNQKRLSLPESKLRPFCEENDALFIKKTQHLSSKYRKELDKAYKKAKKYVNLQVNKSGMIHSDLSHLKNGILNLFNFHH